MPTIPADLDLDNITSKPTQADTLVTLAEGCHTFHTAERQAFIVVPVNGHEETHAVQSKDFRLWLSQQFYVYQDKTPNRSALRDAIDQIEARAIYDAPEQPAYVRIAKHCTDIFIDLCNSDWQAIRITPEDWHIVESKDLPVRFRRTKGMRPLPIPQKPGNILKLRELINVSDDSQWRLLVGWLVMCFNPNGPYPALCFHGQQGSAKSTGMKVLRAIVDPHAMPTRSEPRDERDCMIAATNTRLLAFDNLSDMPVWFSDCICRISTGAGFATRTLYENDEEQLFQAMRPIAMNGIEIIVSRSDLLDRTLLISLQRIPDEKRLTEAELWSKVNTLLPEILGGILEAVKMALTRLSSVPLPKLKRMADFCKWVTAAEPGLGWPDGQFMQDYVHSLAEANEVALESYIITPALLSLMKAAHNWEGTATQLMIDLHAIAGDAAARSADWPKKPKLLSGMLKRMEPNLRQIGINVVFAMTGTGYNRRRSITITSHAVSIKSADSAFPTSPAFQKMPGWNAENEENADFAYLNTAQDSEDNLNPPGTVLMNGVYMFKEDADAYQLSLIESASTTVLEAALKEILFNNQKCDPATIALINKELDKREAQQAAEPEPQEPSHQPK